jgi:carboxymethylenebutenolidase
MVEFQSNGGRSHGYLSQPVQGGGPGVIVIQEWWGLADHIKDVADRFAGAGFVALAPDLYHGELTGEPDEAGKLMMALNVDQAAKDLRGAVTYLLADGGASGSKVAAIGLCMGGQLALYAATVSPDQVGAVADFYGIHPNVHPDLSRLRAPVLGAFAERDAFAPPEAALKLEADIRALGIETDFKIYPGTDHAFFNDDREEVHDAAAAEDAWERTLRFFRQHLS